MIIKGISLMNDFEARIGLLKEFVAGKRVVVVGNAGSERVMNYTVIGDTVNIARRLQQHAAGGSILISKDIYEQLKDIIEAEKLQPLAVAGKSEPITAYRLLRIKAIE
jgi:class 3 adenylate cyclase